MPGRDFSSYALVLKKTKLGESDLILTFLTSEGSLLRAVAKGARKPRSSFASRLELFSVCRLLLHEGKGLALVREARLEKAHASLRSNVLLSCAASFMAELMAHLAQEELENEHFFPLITVAFEELCGLEGRFEGEELAVFVLAFCDAFCLKALSFSGLRPSIEHCAACGAPIGFSSLSWCAFSAAEGGVICPRCKSRCQHVLARADAPALMKRLLFSRFSQIAQGRLDDVRFEAKAYKDLLVLLRMLIEEHVEARIRSFDILFDYCAAV